MDELADSPDFRKFVENEFPASADEMLAPASRRNFLKIMGASIALAGATGCRWPTEEIVPFAHRPDGYTPGEPLRYATAMDLHGSATGLLVTSYDGRPIKVEGNPDHWQSLGGTNAWHQASILELYDPERSQNPVRADIGATRWEDFVTFGRGHFDALRDTGGRKLRILAEPCSSPSREDMRTRLLQAFPQAKWYEYAPLSRDNQREGARLALGGAYRTHLALDRAEFILSLDEDFLLHHPAAVRYGKDFVDGRNPDRDSFSRLYVVESCFSLTGSVADRRIALQNRMIPVFAVCLAAELFLELGLELPPGSDKMRRVLERVQVHPLYTEIDFSFARELIQRPGRTVVAAGPRQPVEIHALVHLINEALGNIGQTVTYTAEVDAERPPHTQAIRELVADAQRGLVETLVVLGGNPVYDAPADVDVAGMLGRVQTSIHLSSFRNETSGMCSWHLPRAHYLETWGDGRDYRGTAGISQPLILPLFDGKSDIELLAQIIGKPPFTGHEIVRRTFFESSVEASSESDWARALHDGSCRGTEASEVRPPIEVDSWTDRLKPFLTAQAREPSGEFELVFMEDSSLVDGRYANNGWLQELPDPLTMLTWDNAALLSPLDAERLGVGQEEMIRLSLGETSLELPVFLMPGQSPGTIGVSLGYGRTVAGEVGNEKGFNIYPFRQGAGMGWVDVQVERTAGRYRLATTQNHFAIDTLGGRERAERAGTLVREVELADYRADPEHAAHRGPHHVPVELYKNWEYEGHKWGMAIDLNTCIGCNVCMIACQAENNIPVVGKAEVLMGREMHWIRVDRYFTGDPLDPMVAHQPVNCQHCENAPCEEVCPVAATVHDSEGLNLMVYNRCVGTRYCANNCPYKVRRFNYFNNHKNEDSLTMMAHNPEVTVRSRGVMEKCTYCVQRIGAAKTRAKNERRAVRDGEITTACAQACPTKAITFGDLNDESSRVARKHGDPRAYAMIEEINVRPRNRFLARVRNRGNESGS
jgi:molybdopterin-containing oxidoreductase family iron-sulfur binding subunit